MKLVERFLAILTSLIDFIVLSPAHNVNPSVQIPVAIDHHNDVIHLPSGPVFTPPGYDTSDNFKCDYSAMAGWTQCWSPGSNLDCWLTSPDGSTNLSINTVYEDVSKTPIGIDRYYECLCYRSGMERRWPQLPLRQAPQWNLPRPLASCLLGRHHSPDRPRRLPILPRCVNTRTWAEVMDQNAHGWSSWHHSMSYSSGRHVSTMSGPPHNTALRGITLIILSSIRTGYRVLW